MYFTVQSVNYFNILLNNAIFFIQILKNNAKDSISRYS